MIDLLALIARFKQIDDVETEQAYYRTRVSSVGPMAYLSIVFKPSEACEQLLEEFSVPGDLLEFYRHWNGARLFFDRLSIYGCVAPGTLLHRSPFAYLPFDIREVNKEFKTELSKRQLLCIGSYGYDRSLVCLRRDSGAVFCAVGDDLGRARAEWESFANWLTQEIPRVAGCFDEAGEIRVPAEYTLPSP